MVLPCFAFSSETSHREVAGKLLEMSNAPATMREAFWLGFEPTIQNMQRQGVSPAAIEEIRAAVTHWYNTEIKWDEIKPKLVDIYVKEFSEQELKELLAFYQTPTGKKSLVKLPALFQQGAAIGQQYFMGKQETLKPLQKKIQEIIEKHRDSKTSPSP